MRKSKCAFLQPSVEYLGHQIDAEGQRATIEKLQAILHAPSPRNVQELSLLSRIAKCLAPPRL